MGISRLVAEWLRNEGLDATHLDELGLRTLRDEDVLERARQEGRVLLTADLDFGQLLAASRGHSPSVITFRLEDETAKNVLRRLQEVLASHRDQLETGAIISVSERAIRVRSLPL